jgi:antirestriction protein ArdC
VQILFKPVDGKVSEEVRAAQPKGNARLIVQYYTVFNRGQIDGLPAVQSTNDPVSPMASIPACEALVQQMHDAPTLCHGEDRAWYSSASDVVNMPNKDLFTTPEEYYSTLFHELIHSTGHKRRLARPGITDCGPFGSTNYSKEELVAEMGATFLSSLTGIDNLTIDNSAAYVQGWIAKLRNDRRILVQAGAEAQRAVDYITDADPSASNCQVELESSA